MAQDVNLWCVACETKMTQLSRTVLEPGKKVQFELLCDPAKGGCGRQHVLTKIFNRTQVTDVFLLTRPGKQDTMRL
jgi:hypothetical protein